MSSQPSFALSETRKATETTAAPDYDKHKMHSSLPRKLYLKVVEKGRLVFEVPVTSVKPEASAGCNECVIEAT